MPPKDRHHTASAGIGQPEIPHHGKATAPVNPGQPRPLTGMGSEMASPLCLCISVSSVYGDLHLSDYKRTWTEGAKKGP